MEIHLSDFSDPSAGTFVTPVLSSLLRDEHYTRQLQCRHHNITRAMVKYTELCAEMICLWERHCPPKLVGKGCCTVQKLTFPCDDLLEVWLWAKPDFATRWRQRTLEMYVFCNWKIFRCPFSLHPQVMGATKMKVLRIYKSLPWCVCNFQNISIAKRKMKTL